MLLAASSAVLPSFPAFIRIALPEMRITLQNGEPVCPYGDPAAQVGRHFHGISLAATLPSGVSPWTCCSPLVR